MIPNKYMLEGERAIASYDFLDIATGTGYKTFYGVDVSGAKVLTTDVFYGRKGFSGNLNTGDTEGKRVSGAFVLNFEVPMTIGGDCIANVPFIFYKNSATTTFSAITSGAFYLVKEDLTETQLGDTMVDTFAFTMAAGEAQLWQVSTSKFELPRTTIKPTEQLKFVVDTGVVTSDLRLLIGHDPKNRTTFAGTNGLNTWTSSQLLINLPIKIDR